MRRVALPLCLVVMLIPLLAQPPTQHDRDRAVAELRASQKLFLDAISGLSEAQLSFKPTPERWSVAECAEHIALSEDSYFDLITNRIMKSPAAPAKKAEVEGKDDLVLKAMADRTSKRIAPEPLQPAHHWGTIEALIVHFNAGRGRFIRYVQSTQDDLRDHFLAHRAVGLIDGYQWILLASGHTVRHTLQINEVKSDPDFPKK
jgi:uncharacterized damage-inducible protein DinB